MNFPYKSLFGLLFAFFSIASYSQSREILTVKHYDALSESLDPDVAARIAGARMDNNNYHSYYAKNNGSISIKSQREMPASVGLATSVFENTFATNSTPAPGPVNKNTTYELLGIPDSKVNFSDIAFIDSTTLVTISYTKKTATLLFVDISSNPMHVSSALNIPVDPPCCLGGQAGIREMFFIDTAAHTIILPVNKMTETVDGAGNLSWKKNSSPIPGIWIIRPVKNEDKKWILDRSQISVNYFSNPSLPAKGKKALRILTAHPDSNGNIWMGFTNGIIGVLPAGSDKTYGNEVALYNFNKDASWYTDMQKRYREELYESLKLTLDEESPDTVNLLKSVNKFPQSFGTQYLENARFRVYSNLVKEKNAQLDSNTTFENPETLWRYVHVSLDNPMDKKKGKLVNYFGYNVRQFQTVQNSIVSGLFGTVYVTTNLGVYKLYYQSKTNSITIDWSTPYKNSFIKNGMEKVASSSSTPAFIAERNEIVVCDNDFPQVNMLVLDAKTGAVKQQFSLFEYAYGSRSTAISYSNNTIVVSNSFGNAANAKDKDAYAASGVMKFTSYPLGKWRQDYDWTKLQYGTIANTAFSKISAPDERAYLYHKGTASWQASSISLYKADIAYPILYSLQPDFSGVLKADLNNYRSNLTIGPKKSLFVGTASGLLRIMSE